MTCANSRKMEFPVDVLLDCERKLNLPNESVWVREELVLPKNTKIILNFKNEFFMNNKWFRIIKE